MNANSDTPTSTGIEAATTAESGTATETGTTADSITAAARGPLERWQDRRERKFLERRKLTAGMLPRLRNRAALRKLVIAYGCVLAAMVVSGIMLAIALLSEGGSAWWGLPWIATTVLLIVTWTTLSIASDDLDGAPPAALDEYERARVEGLRSLAYRCFTWFGLIVSLVLIFFGVWLGDNRPDWAADVPYLFGLAFLIGYLVILSLPTIIIAWTTPDD